MRILGIETSCDETGIAVYDDEKGLLSHELYSQVKLHADYGGVVPEIAARQHISNLDHLIAATLSDAALDIKDLDEQKIMTLRELLHMYPGNQALNFLVYDTKEKMKLSMFLISIFNKFNYNSFLYTFIESLYKST